MDKINWIDLAETKRDEIFDALVDAMRQQHQSTLGSGWKYDVYLWDDGDISIQQNSQNWHSSGIYDGTAICVASYDTFGEYIDPDSWTMSDIKESVASEIDDLFLDIARYHD